jgi:hypothetical protein
VPGSGFESMATSFERRLQSDTREVSVPGTISILISNGMPEEE